MTTIRSFQNSDLPSLLEVWMAHWSSIGPPPQINLPRLEQAIVSRTFFDPQTLLIAETGTTIVGWCHFFVDDDADPDGKIAALCVRPEAEADVDDCLLRESLTRMRASGLTSAIAGMVRDDRHGYAGLEPIGYGIGIPMHDFRVSGALQRFGFAPIDELTRMVASASCYRPPVSREALQLRRSASTRSHRSIPTTPQRASGLSHIDIETFQLADQSGAVSAEVDFWFSDPEAEVLTPSAAILDLGDAHSRGELSSAESYLIAWVLQTLATRNIFQVETVVDSPKKTLIEQLRKICFEPSDVGVRWALKL